MARCKNAELLHKIGVNKLEDWMEVTFSLTSDITNCTTINTRDYTSIATLDHYAMYDRPDNQFDCDGGICTTTGTLYGTGASVFFKNFDATDYASGVMTFYMSGVTTSSSVTVTISSDSEFTDADVYTITPSVVGDDGYAAILVDFTATPTSTEGDGWTASANGVYVKVTTTSAYGISTISFYKSLYELAGQNVVKIACLSEVGGTFDVSALEETCLTKGYDETALDSGFDQTITGKLLTSNYWMLNPLTGMSRYKGLEDGTTGYRIETVKATIPSNGQVEISDINQDVCDFITAQVDDKCVTPAADLLHRILSPVAVTLAYDQFQVLNDTSTGVSTFYFNTDLAGKEVLITYPQKVELKEKLIANDEDLGDVHVKMSYPRYLSDGTEEIHTFNNVLITSFPSSITNEETEFSFTVNIQRDSDGNWFTVQRVLA